jgi:hypothetical protein
MNSNVSTKLIDSTTVANYTVARKLFDAAVKAWLSAILSALNQQQQEAGLIDEDTIVSATTTLLLAELAECQAIIKIMTRATS